MEFFQTGNELGTEQRYLAANAYNLFKTLFLQCNNSCLFVPIRSMQYQAIIDNTEIAFVSAYKRSHIEFIWRKFKPQQRNTLNDPVPYEFVYYDLEALESIKRIQVEFCKYAQQLYDKKHASRKAADQNNITAFKLP